MAVSSPATGLIWVNDKDAMGNLACRTLAKFNAKLGGVIYFYRHWRSTAQRATNRIVFPIILFIACQLSTPMAQAQAQIATLCSFTGTSGACLGANPEAGLILGSDGNFYGTTFNGGSGGYLGCGTVFKITPDGSFTMLHVFNGLDGGNPRGGLIQGRDGNFYGTTSFGTVFKMTPDGTLTTLCSFNDASGLYPSGLTQGSDGNFYGTTYGQPAGPYGTVFKVTPSGNLTILCRFAGGNNGYNPMAGLIQGNDGNFYGTTYEGDFAQGLGHGYGTIFRITPDGTLTTLCKFNGNNGTAPYGKLIQATDGNFYGTTSEGAFGHGTVFKITSSGSLTTLCSFNGTNGATPYGGLIQGCDGNFYGTTLGGGSSSCGTIFKVTPSGALTTLCTFNGTNGAAPYGELVWGNDGLLYGTTANGGSGNNGYGTVFKLMIPPLVPINTLAGFRTNNGLSADGSQDALTPAGDGVPNLFKYAFNMIGSGQGQTPNLGTSNNQTLGVSGMAGLPLVNADGTGKLSITFVRRKAASSPGISYVVEFSNDLSANSWAANSSATESATSIDSTFERVTVTDSVTGLSRRFIRVRITEQ